MITANLSAIFYLISGILFILALRGLSSPDTSRQGNYFGIAGMIIAAWAIGADKAYVFMRGEYHEAFKQLQQAIVDAQKSGYIGEGIFGTSFNLDLSM